MISRWRRVFVLDIPKWSQLHNGFTKLEPFLKSENVAKNIYPERQIDVTILLVPNLADCL